VGVDSGNGRLTETALTGWFVLSQRCELRIRSAQLATPVTSRAGWAARCWVSADRATSPSGKNPVEAKSAPPARLRRKPVLVAPDRNHLVDTTHLGQTHLRGRSGCDGSDFSLVVGAVGIH
jgi:hypothetical protein